MTSTLIHIAAGVAGLAIVAACFVTFPGQGMKGLAKGVGVTVSLAVVAAIVITAARAFGS
jgi:hypothetical protein